MLSSFRLPTSLAAAVATALLASSALAHSVSRNPLKNLGTLHNVSIDTTSHRVTALSSFDLSFAIHDPQGSDGTSTQSRPRRKVRLALEPNHDILPPQASVKYLAADGTVKREEPIDRLNHKVYRGTAWVQELGPQGDDLGKDYYAAGTARIVIRRDGNRPLFEGSFDVRHDHHHVKSSSSYRRTRHAQDPELPGTADVDDEEGDEYLVVFKDSDLAADGWNDAHHELKRDLNSGKLACEADSLDFNMQLNHPIRTMDGSSNNNQPGYSPNLLGMPFPSIFRRQLDDGFPGFGNGAGVNLETTIGETSGCPNNRKVALIGVVTDCSYTASFDSDTDVRENIIAQINSASNLFEKTFNIAIALQNLTVSEPDCPSEPSSLTPWNAECGQNFSIKQRLNVFSSWRGEQVPDSNSHWMLLTACDAGSAVGLAWLGQACESEAFESNPGGDPNTGENDISTGANVVVRTTAEWQVIAHETGHIFGAVHDCDQSACGDSDTLVSQQCCPLSDSTCSAGERFIMNPSTARGITEFSPCSIGNICSAIGRNSVSTACFSDNRGVNTIITSQQCGNGIVEEGEDCDCGGEESCGDNSCCDAETCKFIGNAVCDDANESCCEDCQFASSQKVCRESTGSCDPEERCTGESPLCPTDQTASDGDSCTIPDIGEAGKDENLQCASGQCTSRDHQCRTLMGGFSNTFGGGSSNDTYACDSQTCQLSCQSPESGVDRCFGLQQNFLDGTPCGNGNNGRCRNGLCNGGGFADEVGSWIEENKEIVIGVGAGLGGLLALSIVWCCVKRCRRRRAMKKFNAAAAAAAAAGAASGHNRGPPNTSGPMGPGALFGAAGLLGHRHQNDNNGHSRNSRGIWPSTTPAPVPPPYSQYSHVRSGSHNQNYDQTPYAGGGYGNYASHARGSSGSDQGLLAAEASNNMSRSNENSISASPGDTLDDGYYLTQQQEAYERFEQRHRQRMSQQQPNSGGDAPFGATSGAGDNAATDARAISPMPSPMPMPPLTYSRMSARYA